MLGDILLKNLGKLSKADVKKTSPNTFWIILRDIAKEEILNLYPEKVDSDVIVAVYYDILASHADYIPPYYRKIVKSNGQERFRVANRNLFTSNAFHPDGLANQKGIIAVKEINPNRKGDKIIYQGDINYVNKQ